MRQILISFRTISIFLSSIALNLLADIQTEYPKLYKSLWPEFCMDHLLNQSSACSEMSDQELNYETDRYEDYDDWDTFFRFPLSVNIDTTQIKDYENDNSLLPNLQSPCAYVFCSHCKKPVLKGIGIINSEWHDNWFIMNHACECAHHFLDIDPKKSYLVKGDKDWICCKKSTVPLGYFNQFTSKYVLFLKHHLYYSKSNPTCKCYWPYLSKTACQISDLVYDQMHPLFQESTLSDLVNKHYDWPYITDFSLDEWPEIGNESLLRTLQNHFIFSFFYSNYHTSIINLCSYVDANSLKPSLELQKLYNVLAQIRPLFLNLYSTCLEQHPHPKIYYERGMVYFHDGDLYASLTDMRTFTESANSNELDELITSDFYLNEGTSYAELGQYDEAITALSKSISKDPENKEAYFERAAVYFEIGDFDLAIADYLDSGLQPTPIEATNISAIAFSTSLISGLLRGGDKATEEFFPSLLASVNGLSHGIWSLACDPVNCSKEMVDSCREMIQFLSDKSKTELLETFVPEINDLNNCQSEQERADLLGYIIGKYGMEILAPAGIMKAYKKMRSANRALTLNQLSKESAAIKKAAAKWNKAHLESIEKFRTSEAFLKTYKGQVLTETKIRKILHKTGFKTFPRPKGIPANFRVAFSDKGCGMKYINPENIHESLRVMPGKPHSIKPHQTKPYIIYQKHGKTYDKFGNIVDGASAEAHIPINEFVFEGVFSEIIGK